MRSLLLVTLLPLFLIACTAQENCEAKVRREISDITAQIDEVEDNLARGYAYIPTQVRVGVQFCAVPGGNVSICSATDKPSYRRVKIDPAAERAKLIALQKRRAALEQSYAQCAVAYPEG